MKFMSLTIAGATALGLIAGTMVAAPVAAQDAEALINIRKAHMRLNGFNIGPLGAMAQGDIPYDAEVAAASAANLAAIASIDQTRYWAEGTGRPDAENTRALAAIWENPDDFRAKQDGLVTATAALADVAGNGLEALQGAMGGVGGACGACHRTYRAEQ